MDLLAQHIWQSGPFLRSMSIFYAVISKIVDLLSQHMAKWTFSLLDDHLITRVSAKKWTFLPSIWPSGPFLCQMTYFVRRVSVKKVDLFAQHI